MINIPPGYKIDTAPYEAAYGDLIKQVSRAFAEAATSGDAAAVLFLIKSLEIIVYQANEILTRIHKMTGNA